MDTKDQILTAARAAFDRHGPEGLSMRDIAKEVGITPMAIYRHYENKQALIDALVLDALGEWSRRAEAIPAGAPLLFLARIGEAFLDFALDEPRRFEAAFLIHTTKARRYPDDFIAGHSPAGTLQLNAITQATADGIFADISPGEILVTIAGLAQGLVSLHRAGRIAGGEEEFRALYRRAMRRTIESFLKEKSP
ncbi:MAG: TetR/AcrR family transcriptional regulator [Proteobacteria bacterium]|nr:TetR/AcrR family transcriptional regulator [Pseudomonadota bacterium]